jgi:arylformamidase
MIEDGATTYPISDWDTAYANGRFIPEGSAYPERWRVRAEAFRDQLRAAGRSSIDLAYGPSRRNRLDLFLPAGRCKGLVVFVHGGFWMQFDKSYWSHLASGPLESGYAVALPSYSLCPDVRISDITKEIAAAIELVATKVLGEIFLCGHSAGGHLVVRMICQGSPLNSGTSSRIARTLSISGLHDLRPLMAANDVLRLEDEEATVESPALLRPCRQQALTCWVGADERPEFIRQNELMGQMWRGFDTEVVIVQEPNRHHFNVIDGLAQVGHPLTRALLAGSRDNAKVLL